MYINITHTNAYVVFFHTKCIRHPAGTAIFGYLHQREEMIQCCNVLIDGMAKYTPIVCDTHTLAMLHVY